MKFLLSRSPGKLASSHSIQNDVMLAYLYLSYPFSETLTECPTARSDKLRCPSFPCPGACPARSYGPDTFRELRVSYRTSEKVKNWSNCDLGSISSTVLCAGFSRLFCAQLFGTCEWQPAQLSATCEWHDQQNFCTKKHGEIHFQKQAAFLSFAWKSCA